MIITRHSIAWLAATALLTFFIGGGLAGRLAHQAQAQQQGDASSAAETEPPEPAPADLPAPGGQAGWHALDLSQHMNRDIIQTPNEWLRCFQIYHEALLASDDQDRTAVASRITCNRVFGDHSIARWSSLSYHVVGSYPHLKRDEEDENRLYMVHSQQDEGLPRDGKIGPFRLYMDELESADWRVANQDNGRIAGRNAISISRWRQDLDYTLTLAEPDRRRYKSLNLLFAAGDYGCKNYIQLLAEYEDGHTALLYEGGMMDYHGPEVYAGDRRGYDQPEGQVVYYRYQSKSGGYRTPGFSSSHGPIGMNVFERPLKLDPRRKLKALKVQTIMERDDKLLSGEHWVIYIFAAIAMPAD